MTSEAPAGAHDGGFDDSGMSAEQLAWGVPSPPRSYWPARIAVAAAIVLYLPLPGEVVPGPRLLVPAMEAAVLMTLSAFYPHHTHVQATGRRQVALCLTGLVSAANIANLAMLLPALIDNREQGRMLLAASVAIWLTNVIVFSLWYWELDRGGPSARHDPGHREPDFLFPQMTTPGAGRPDWAPAYVDYLYLSFTNATAFSPTDTLPLTAAAKSLMAVQAAASLVTVAVVAARAVNILA